MNCGLLTVHVKEGRNFSSKQKQRCDAYVKISLILEEQKKSRCKTKVFFDSNNPVFDEKFSFELLTEDIDKRLLFSVWHKDQTRSPSDFLGCFSFGVKHLIHHWKKLEGWYHLLTEKLGRKKHMLVSGKQKQNIPMQGQHGIPCINKDLWGMDPVRITIGRGKHGFGFSIVDACPVRVSRVDGASPASKSELKVNDRIVRVNGLNVSRSTTVSVAKLIRHCGSMVTLDIQRPKSVEPMESSPWKPQVVIDEDRNSIKSCLSDRNSSDEGGNKENEISVDEDMFWDSDGIQGSSVPFLVRNLGLKELWESDQRKMECVQRLMMLESEFVSFMNYGLQQYLWPLKHCILSQHQHSLLFQNLEELVTISEYHLKQMQDNVPSCSETDDTSQSDAECQFMYSVGMIYQSKVNMLCQAYQSYAQGIGEAVLLLKDLKKNPDFQTFVQLPPLDSAQPTIQGFISRPVKHTKKLYLVLRGIFMNTGMESADYFNLKQVVEGLQKSIGGMNNHPCCLHAHDLSTSTEDSQDIEVSSSLSSSTTGSLVKQDVPLLGHSQGKPVTTSTNSTCSSSVAHNLRSQGLWPSSLSGSLRRQASSSACYSSLERQSKSQSNSVFSSTPRSLGVDPLRRQKLVSHSNQDVLKADSTNCFQKRTYTGGSDCALDLSASNCPHRVLRTCSLRGETTCLKETNSFSNLRLDYQSNLLRTTSLREHRKSTDATNGSSETEWRNSTQMLRKGSLGRCYEASFIPNGHNFSNSSSVSPYSCPARSCSSSYTRRRMTASMYSTSSSYSVDSEVARIQERLHFPPDIPVFQLCKEKRHFIFSGDIFKWDANLWIKLQMMLFSDLILQIDQEADGSLRVVGNPLFLSDLVAMETHRNHATEIILHKKSPFGTERTTFRCPNIDQKFTWKNLIEQRILTTVGGSLENFISSDVSTLPGVIV